MESHDFADELERVGAERWRGAGRARQERRTHGEGIGPTSGRKDAGLEITYQKEDPYILETFERELAKNGIDPRPIKDWRKS